MRKFDGGFRSLHGLVALAPEHVAQRRECHSEGHEGHPEGQNREEGHDARCCELLVVGNAHERGAEAQDASHEGREADELGGMPLIPLEADCRQQDDANDNVLDGGVHRSSLGGCERRLLPGRLRQGMISIVPLLVIFVNPLMFLSLQIDIRSNLFYCYARVLAFTKTRPRRVDE